MSNLVTLLASFMGNKAPKTWLDIRNDAEQMIKAPTKKQQEVEKAHKSANDVIAMLENARG